MWDYIGIPEHVENKITKNLEKFNPNKTCSIQENWEVTIYVIVMQNYLSIMHMDGQK